MFELGAPLQADQFRPAGLQVVDSSSSLVAIAFADDPEMAGFLERIDAMQGPIPEAQKSERFAQFFDSIVEVRPYGPQDRLTENARATIAATDPETELRLDVECWHRGRKDLVAESLDDLKRAVEEAGGRITASMTRDAIGLILARVYLPAGRLAELSKLDAIAQIDVLPTPALSVPQLFDLDVSDLPALHPPPRSAPIIGLVDSGVASAHALLAGCVIAAEPLGTGISDGQDEHGHGTMVASLLLHGDVETALGRGLPLRPFARIVSARVLDDNNSFPEEDLWEEDLARAIEWCARQGAAIINLSLGDLRSPFSPPRQMTAAAIVDELARRLNLTIIVATGNSWPAEYLPALDEISVHNYPNSLLEHASSNILDPGTALLAITVGGIVTASASGAQSGWETPTLRPVGEPNWPSPITRIGPGPASAIKPELVENSGTLGFEDGRLVQNDAELGVIGARAKSGRLLMWDVGTSYAAPIVTRIASAVRRRFPDFSADLVRSLVVLSANRINFGSKLEGTPSQQLEAEQRSVGYGRPDLSRAIEATSHRAVLVTDTEIPINGVHVYELPLPSSFLESGGERGIDISLSFSPAVRVRRLDYLSSRMEFHLVRGIPLDEVQKVFAQLGGQDLDVENASSSEGVMGEDPEDAVADGPQPRRPSGLGSALVKLTPSTSVRSKGANQLGRIIFKKKLVQENNSPLYIVVRNVNRWADEQSMQSYALSVALWRDEEHPELHAELEALLEAVIEVPIEVEIEV